MPGRNGVGVATANGSTPRLSQGAPAPEDPPNGPRCSICPSVASRSGRRWCQGRGPIDQAVSWLGIDCFAGTGYTGMALAGATSKMASSVQPNAMTLAIWSFDVLGSLGTTRRRSADAAPR